MIASIQIVAAREADEQLVLGHHDSADFVIGELGHLVLPDDVSGACIERV